VTTLNKALLFLIFSSLSGTVFAASAGSVRIGGTGSSGKGSHYIGGTGSSKSSSNHSRSSGGSTSSTATPAHSKDKVESTPHTSDHPAEKETADGHTIQQAN
jgi:hypothetical protein